MKKINLFLGVVSSFLVSSFVFSDSNSLLNPNFNNNSRYLNEPIKVSTYQQLESAMSSKNDVTIVFENDIDLSDFTGNYITNNKSSTSQDIIIDGNGHGFVNKPSDYYSNSIFDNLKLNSSNTVSITFRNIALDNIGSFIRTIDYYAIEDYDAANPDPTQANLIGKGVTFQNITIKNNVKENQTFYINPHKNNDFVFQPLSLLLNNIYLYYYNSTSDLGLTFRNILIKDNHIDNNNFYIVNDSNSSLKPKITESFLANLVYINYNYQNRTNHAFVTYEYIYIRDNSFTNNSFKIGHYTNNNFIFDDFDDASISESFGNLSGNANGLVYNPGTSGNYLMIHDIYLSNNVVTESKKYNKNGELVINHYSYSELISNSKTDTRYQYTSTLTLDNIFIFNEEAYFLNGNENYELFNESNSIILDIPLLDKNNNVNSWSNLSSDSENFYIYGPMYDSDHQIKMFKDVSISSENKVNYDKYLFEDDYNYYTLVNFLTERFGIYGYEINFDPVEDEGETKNAVNSISIVEKDHITILSDNLVYDGNSANLTQVELSFKYFQNYYESGAVKVPYKIDNLKLYNDKNANQKFEPGEIVASSNEVYQIKNDIYNIKLNLINETQINQEFLDNLDLNNLYLGFDYSNDSTQKVSGSTILKIDPNQLEASFIGTPLPEVVNEHSTNSTLLIIIGSVVGLIVLIVLITLLIALILWLLKRKKTKNNYYENEYYEPNQIGYDNNYYYPDNSHYYDNYELNNYYLDNQNYDYDPYDYDPYYEEDDI